MCVATKLNHPEVLPKTAHFHVHRLPDLRSALLGITVSTMYFALLMGILLSTLAQAEVPEPLRASEVSEGCFKDGRPVAEGEEFDRTFLRYKCVGGIAQVIACYIDENRRMNADEDVVDPLPNGAGRVHRCFYDETGRIAYEEYPCGFRDNPPCSPLPNKPQSIREMERIMTKSH